MSVDDVLYDNRDRRMIARMMGSLHPFHISIREH